MNPPTRRLPLLQLLVCSSLIPTLAMGIRHGFGLWLQPVTQDQGWTSETAIERAPQRLAGQPR